MFVNFLCARWILFFGGGGVFFGGWGGGGCRGDGIAVCVGLDLCLQVVTVKDPYRKQSCMSLVSFSISIISAFDLSFFFEEGSDKSL